jgi:hypothetical protein
MRWWWGLALVSLVGCGERASRPAGETVTENRTGEMGQAEVLSAEIRMGAGELTVEPGDRAKVEGVFHYTVGAPAPAFRFDSRTFRARLAVEQSGVQAGATENRWTVKLPVQVATDLEVSMGAGEAKLRLGGLDLRKVVMRLGAGKVEADFRGEPKRDYEILVQGGVGECEVMLPKRVGLRAEAMGGLGEIDVEGLDKKSGYWESAGFDGAKVKVRLKVQGGIGRIGIRVQ